MSQEESKAVVRRYWEGFNAHNLDVWDEVCTRNFINHDPGLPGQTAAGARSSRSIPGFDPRKLQRLLPDELRVEAFHYRLIRFRPEVLCSGCDRVPIPRSTRAQQ